MLAAGALTAIAIIPMTVTQPASAGQPPAAAPTDTTSKASDTSAHALIRPFVLVAPPARQGMGDRPATHERVVQAASRNLLRPPRQVRHVAIRAVAVKKLEYAGRHRTEPAKSTHAKKVVHRIIKRTATRAKPRKSTRWYGGRGRAAIVAYARAHLGAAYVSNAAGPRAFDCSGLVMRAYQAAGISLPHSSGAIAARARPVSRSAARPGDIVVGAGHVGIYMGGGKMIDAGNPRVDVSYRTMYAGLHVETVF